MRRPSCEADGGSGTPKDDEAQADGDGDTDAPPRRRPERARRSSAQCSALGIMAHPKRQDIRHLRAKPLKCLAAEGSTPEGRRMEYRRPEPGLAQAQQEAQAYTAEWYRMMTRIWTDRIGLMGAIKTGRLISSVRQGTLKLDGWDITATYRFVEYGLYVDRGTGNGYRRGNGGNLAILDPAYRKRKGLKKQRRRRPWFTNSWHISREVLKDKLAELMGEGLVAAWSQIATR